MESGERLYNVCMNISTLVDKGREENAELLSRVNETHAPCMRGGGVNCVTPDLGSEMEEAGEKVQINVILVHIHCTIKSGEDAHGCVKKARTERFI